jgi:hypothetical protein
MVEDFGFRLAMIEPVSETAASSPVLAACQEMGAETPVFA